MTINQSRVDEVYDQLRAMATHFEFKPDERINEGSLAARLGTIRTPLREALNRLVAEGFLTFQKGRGFLCRSLAPDQILALYKARQAIECEALSIAVARASDDEINDVMRFLQETEAAYSGSSSAEALVELDEAYHLRLVRMARNPELERILTNVNARIRYVRWIDMSEGRSTRGRGTAQSYRQAQRRGDPGRQNGLLAALRADVSDRLRRTKRVTIRQGGKAIYGASAGILMLEARFPRIPCVSVLILTA